jgi:hypothetical protein
MLSNQKEREIVAEMCYFVTCKETLLISKYFTDLFNNRRLGTNFSNGESVMEKVRGTPKKFFYNAHNALQNCYTKRAFLIEVFSNLMAETKD